MKLVFKTPAKINLGLHIDHKRSDGFHELETLLQMVSLYDEIELESQAGGIDLQCDAPGIPQDESNLAVRAARMVQESCSRRGSGVRIRISKKIPAGAGLGGGSGNAAGVLMGLNVLWDLKMSRQDLVPLAAKLGSDVPFFLTSPCALGRGRGELLESVQPAEKFQVILYYPGFPIATSWVYQNLNLKLTKGENNISILRQNLSQSNIGCLGERLFNDLEPVVIKKYPTIQVITSKLLAHGAKGALLSGSGSTVFAIFDDPDQAESAYANIQGGDGELFFTETINSFSEFLPGEILNYP